MKTVTLSANTSWYLYNFRSATISRLRESGYRVVCLAPEDAYSQRLAAELRCDWRPLVMDNRGSNPFLDGYLCYQLWRHYRQLKPAAALHFTIKNNVYGTWAARSLGISAINNVSGLGTAFIRPGAVSAVARLLYRASQPFAHRVFCQNEEDQRQLVAGRLVAAERVELLPGSGVNLQRFHPDLREVHEGPFRFLYAGRMLADKGLHELVAAVRGINAAGLRCSLWLCGFADADNVSAVDAGQLRAWADTAGVEWLGSSDAMETLYARVDCVVLPSYREGLPRSLLEAGAMGLPSIATNVPGCRSVVTDGVNGLLCEAGDSEDLRRAMEQMLTFDQDTRDAMGAHARARVEAGFDERDVVDAALRAVQSVT
jgi:glycosyltransferase involved in cell wall biosynthesis